MKILLKLLYTALLIPTLLLAEDMEDFGKQMGDFYLSPSQQKFESFQIQAGRFEEKLCAKDNGTGLLVSVMIAEISKKHSWPISGEGKIATMASEIVKGESDLAKYVEDDKQIDPGKLDVWWCSYFATGETKYLDKLLAYAGEELPEGDINKMMIVGAATWSFKSNCNQHESIKRYTLAQIENPEYAHKKSFLKECAGVPLDDGFSWRDEKGNPVPDSENKKTKDGFGAQLLITDNLDFYEDWKKPEMPRISVAKTMAIGEMVIPLVIYVNPKKNGDGRIDVTCDFMIVRPDGSIAQEIPNVPCGSGEFKAPQYNLQLSQSELRWSADKGDPVGEWKFKVTIKDNNRGVEIPLATSIKIEE